MIQLLEKLRIFCFSIVILLFLLQLIFFSNSLKNEIKFQETRIEILKNQLEILNLQTKKEVFYDNVTIEFSITETDNFTLYEPVMYCFDIK